MSKRRGESDGTGTIVLCAFLFGSILCGTIGYNTGWDVGVRDAVAGKATVITKPDGTTEACKVKEASNDGT
jgi:hypothetical protein